MLAPRHLRGGACTRMKMELQGHVASRLAWKCLPPFSQRVADRIPLKISPTQPPDGVRGGPHTLTARGAA